MKTTFCELYVFSLELCRSAQWKLSSRIRIKSNQAKFSCNRAPPSLYVQQPGLKLGQNLQLHYILAESFSTISSFCSRIWTNCLLSTYHWNGIKLRTTYHFLWARTPVCQSRNNFFLARKLKHKLKLHCTQDEHFRLIVRFLSLILSKCSLKIFSQNWN